MDAVLVLKIGTSSHSNEPHWKNITITENKQKQYWKQSENNSNNNIEGSPNKKILKRKNKKEKD